MYQRIFVPVDNSEASFTALSEACKLAKKSEGKIRIVHVVDMTRQGWGSTDFVQATELQQNADEQSEILLHAKQFSLLMLNLSARSSKTGATRLPPPLQKMP